MELKNGRYRARGIQAALGKSSKGNEQVAVEFELLDDEGTPGPHITWFGFFTEKTMERTIESLRVCGWQGDDLSDLSGIDANEVSLVIENEEWEGKWTPRVKWVNAPGGGLALKEQLSPEETRSFAASMRGKIAAMNAARGQRKPVQPSQRRAVLSPEPPPYAEQDDIGF